jgi:lipopolysaccharide transport system ATP-binding protein
MSTTAISIENISKSYRLGEIGTGTFRGDLRRWWARQRGKPDPYLKIGEPDYGNRVGETLWALKDINLNIEQGETLGIIGRNGAGKSTLLKILSRVTAPTSGQVKMKGCIASLLEVGTGFHPDLTGRENIFLNGAIMGMSKIDISRKFDEIVNFSGEEKFIDTPVKRYSSGMYVRLAFAVAAHMDPEILIVDEVLAVGDAEFQQKCLGKMGEVSREGRTVLFVSHNMGSIRRLCSTVAWLDRGMVKELDQTSLVVGHYIEKLIDRDGQDLLQVDSRNKDLPGLKFTKCVLLDYFGNETSFIHYGEDLRVRAYFSSEIIHKKVTVAVNINTPEGTLIQNSNNLITNYRMDLEKGKGWIECLFKGVQLIPGRYTITIAACDLIGKYFDWIDDAISFEVIESPAMKVVSDLNNSYGIVWFPVNYQMHVEE